MGLPIIIILILFLGLIGLCVFLYLKYQKMLKRLTQISNQKNLPLNNPNPIMTFNAEGELIFSNKASASLKSYWSIKEGELLPELWAYRIRDCLLNNESAEHDIEWEDRVYGICFKPNISTHEVHLYGIDITERRLAEKALIKKAIYDPVTDLPNRT